MRRLRSLLLRFTPAAVLLAVALNPGPAKADITLFDHDGWSFYTTGLVAAHYQLILGDADPNARLSLAGGRLLDEGTATNNTDPTNKTTTLSNIRSGFVGTQIGFGVNHQISQSVRVESLLALNVAGINSNRGQDLGANKQVDYREAWAAIVSPYGTFKFGRMFGIFGEGSAEVMMMAFRYGVGHPCVVDAATIACGSSGAGPLYAGFDSAMRYISPRFAGFQFVLSVADPVVAPFAKMSPVPRVDSELTFDQTFGGLHLRLIGQSMFDRIGTSSMGTVDAMGNVTPGTVTWNNVWGVMGTGIVSFAGLNLGGGAWTGKGVGERIPLEANDPGNPISIDSSLELRLFRGFYGNAQYELAGNAITVGGGELFVRPTAVDDMVTSNFVLIDQFEYHVTFDHKFDPSIVVHVEFMHWHTDWHDDPMNPDRAAPAQSLNFMGGGVNYLW